MTKKPVCFTVKFDGFSNVLKSPVFIHKAFNPKTTKVIPPHREYQAIWDTGATGTVITKRVANECGLKPVGLANVNTASGPSVVDVYLVNVLLPNGLGIHGVKVTEGILSGDANVLIGMDIISRGDMAITNYDKKTVFSYRYPSTERIDFVEEVRGSNIVRTQKIKGSEPCPCGSGKKFKNCCRNKSKK